MKYFITAFCLFSLLNVSTSTLYAQSSVTQSVANELDVSLDDPSETEAQTTVIGRGLDYVFVITPEAGPSHVEATADHFRNESITLSTRGKTAEESNDDGVIQRVTLHRGSAEPLKVNLPETDITQTQSIQLDGVTYEVKWLDESTVRIAHPACSSESCPGHDKLISKVEVRVNYALPGEKWVACRAGLVMEPEKEEPAAGATAAGAEWDTTNPTSPIERFDIRADNGNEFNNTDLWGGCRTSLEVIDFVDTNRDDLVNVGHDISSWGPDTGTLGWQNERETPQVYVPLATAMWNQLPVKAYLAQGAFDTVKNDFWLPDAAETPDGTFFHYSLHSRVALVYEDIDADGDPKAKRAVIFRPRGNGVSFEFPLNSAEDGYEAYGHPKSKNELRTYVLWDRDVDATEPGDIELRFESGLIHRFGKELEDTDGFSQPLIDEIESVDGRKAELATLYGMPLVGGTNHDNMISHGPRYSFSLTWSNGELSDIEYASRLDNSETITTTPTYDAGTEMVVGLEKTDSESAGIDVTSSRFNGGAIEYGKAGELSRTVSRSRTGNQVTYVQTVIGADTADNANQITTVIELSNAELVKKRTVTFRGDSASWHYYYADGEASTDRFAKSQALRSTKLKMMTGPMGSWAFYVYQDAAESGWPVKTYSGYLGSEPPTVANWSVDTAPLVGQPLHREGSFDYAVVSGSSGDAAQEAWLAERPRTSESLIKGTVVSRSLSAYTNDGKDTETRLCETPTDGWADAKLIYTSSLKPVRPANRSTPTGSVEYTESGIIGGDAKKLTLTATVKGKDEQGVLQNVAETESVVNCFGIAEKSESKHYFGGGTPTTVASSTASTPVSFGRFSKYTGKDGYYSESTSFEYWGPTSVKQCDPSGKVLSASTLNYTVHGWPDLVKSYPSGDTGATNLNTTRTITKYDAMGTALESTVVYKKTGQADVTKEYRAEVDVLGRVTSSGMKVEGNWKDFETTYPLPVTAETYTVTAEQPDNTTYTAVYHRDGTIKESSGTASYPVRYEYGVTGNDTWAQVIRTNDEDDSDSDPYVWSKSYSNMLGQTYKTEIPDNNGNARTAELMTFDPDTGRPLTIKDIRGVVTSVEIDERGEITKLLAGTGQNTRQIITNTSVAGDAINYTTTVGTGTTSSTFQSEMFINSPKVRSKANSQAWTTNEFLPTGNGDWQSKTEFNDGTYTVATVVDGYTTQAQMLDTNEAAYITTSRESDAAGRTTEIASRNGNVTTQFSNINEIGQAALVTLPNGGQIARTAVDTMMRWTGIELPDNSTQSITYNQKGQVTEAGGAHAYQTEHTFDSTTGVLTDLKTDTRKPRTEWIRNKYTQLPTAKKIVGEQIITLDYDPATLQLTQVSYPDGFSRHYTYDASLGDVATIQLKKTENQVTTTLRTYTPTYDSQGRVTQLSDSVLGDFVYELNADSRLTSETLPASLDSKQITYEYGTDIDPATGQPVNGINRNQGLKVTGILSQTFDYDNATQRLSGTTADGNTYAWNYLADSNLPDTVTFESGMTTDRNYENTTNRVTSLTSAIGGNTLREAEFSYNLMDQRTEAEMTVFRTSAGVSESFIIKSRYDDDDPIAFDDPDAADLPTVTRPAPITDNFGAANWSTDWLWSDYSSVATDTRTASIDNNQGKVILTPDGNHLMRSVAWLGQDAAQAANVDMTVTFKVDDIATSEFGLVARSSLVASKFGDDTDSLNAYYLRVFKSGTDHKLEISQVGQGITIIAYPAVTGSNTNITFTNNTEYKLRFRIETNDDGDAVLAGKVWAASASEPTAWTITAVTDTRNQQFLFGRIGMMFSALQSTTARTFYVDDFTCNIMDDHLTKRDFTADADGDDPDWPSGWKYDRNSATGTTPADDFSRDDHEAVVELSAATDTETAQVVATVDNLSRNTVDLLSRFSFSKSDTEAEDVAAFGLVARGNFDESAYANGSADTGYLAIIQPAGGDGTGATTIKLRKDVSGSSTDLASDNTTFTGASRILPDTAYRVRFRVTENTQGHAVLKLKVWKESDAEPVAWSLTHTDTSPLSPGSVGYFFANTGDDNVSTFKVDNFSARPTRGPDAALAAYSVTDDRIDLVWAPTPASIQGFKLETSPDGSAWTTLSDSIPATQLGYFHTGLSASSQHYYRLTAKDALVNATSNVVSTYTTPEQPAKRTGNLIKGHLAGYALARQDGTDLKPIPGRQFHYAYDENAGVPYNGLGNRSRASLYASPEGETTYAYNTKNQTTSVQTPGVVHISGFAKPGEQVYIEVQSANGQTHSRVMAQRDGPRYYASVDVANTTGPQAVHITIDARVVKPDGSETDLTNSYWRIIDDDNHALTYDGRGNLTDDGIYQYTFDVRGRLTQVATKTTLDTDDVPTHLWAKLVYDYDPQGRRVTKKVYRWNDSLNGGAGGWNATPATSLRFIWAGWNMLAEVDATTGKPVRSYIWGQDLSGGVGGAGGVDGLLAVRHHDATGAVEKRYDVVRDERSNVAGLIDENGKLVAGFEYTPFGQIAAIDSADPAVLADPAALCPLLFSMKYLERELLGSATGQGQVYYFGYRYLDARLGKWLSRDPIAEEGGLNLYAYVMNDPVNYVDPVGLELQDRTGGQVWVVRQGDTLWSISEELMGHGKYWTNLGYQGEPESLQIGEEILLPGFLQPARFTPSSASVVGDEGAATLIGSGAAAQFIGSARGRLTALPDGIKPHKFLPSRHVLPRYNGYVKGTTTLLLSDPVDDEVGRMYREALKLAEGKGTTVKLSNGQSWYVHGASGKFHPTGGAGTVTLGRAEANLIHTFMVNAEKNSAKALDNLSRGLNGMKINSISDDMAIAIQQIASENGIKPRTVERFLVAFAKDAKSVQAGVKTAAQSKFPNARTIRYVKWGGRVLIVVGVGLDAYEIYHAENKAKTITKKVGAWTASVAASGVAAKATSPLLLAGPKGWVGYGVIVMGSGVGGYFVGGEITETVYEWTFEEWE